MTLPVYNPAEWASLPPKAQQAHKALRQGLSPQDTQQYNTARAEAARLYYETIEETLHNRALDRATEAWEEWLKKHPHYTNYILEGANV